MPRDGMAAADVDRACIEALAASEAAATDLATDLVCERDSYRLLAQQLLHRLHRTLRDCDQINRRLRRLDAECRRLRDRLGCP